MFELIVAAMLLIGSVAVFRSVIKNKYNCSKEEADYYIAEVVKDIRYRRSEKWIHVGDFPRLLRNELLCLFNEQEQAQWDKILSRKSTPSEWSGIVDGLPSYSFIIPWHDENEEEYIMVCVLRESSGSEKAAGRKTVWEIW